jgi:NADP-dependent 3-hydroxy acid dehydrogenase YdfG
MALNPRIHQWNGQRVWLVGASSGIGAALATQLQQRGAKVAVSARRADALTKLVTSEQTLVLPLDVTDLAQCRASFAQILQAWSGVDLVIWLAGNYKPMQAQSFAVGDAVDLLKVNYEAVLNGLDSIVPQLIKQRHGHLALVSSVAGYGGLPKALAYGPTKAAMINLTEILYLDLHPKGIGVHLISPGFVETPLTAQNDFHMPALITPDQAANAILAGLEAGRFEIAFPKRFTNWLRVLRLVPYRIYFAAISRFTGL